MFRTALVATLGAAVVELGNAGWDYTVRTMDQRRTVNECLEVAEIGDFDLSTESASWTFPSPEVSQAESTITTATMISIKYASTFKVVTNSHSKEQYVLTQCGVNAPTDLSVNSVEALPANYTRKHFTIPLQKAIVTSTTMLGFVDALGLQERMMAVSAYSVAPCWQQARTACNSTLEEYGNATLEGMQKDAADGVFMDCSASGCPADKPNAIDFFVTVDPGNLHQAEYIKYMAAFFNKETEANQIFADKLQAYTSMAAYANKPVVAWISFEAGNQWNGNEDKFILSRTAYKLQYVTDAGFSNPDVAAIKAAVPKFRETPTHLELWVSDFGNSKADASAAFFGALNTAYAVIDEFYAPEPVGYTIDSFYSNYGLTSSSNLPFIADQRVLRIDSHLSEDNNLDWYEGRVANPEQALQGLRRALTGDNSMTKRFFRNVAAGETPIVMLKSECTTATALPMCADVLSTPILHADISAISAAWAPGCVTALLLSAFVLAVRA